MSEPGKIYSVMPKIAKAIGAIGKNKENTNGPRFKFRGIDDVYNAVSDIMADHGVFNTPKIKEIERHQITSSNGNAGWHIFTRFEFHFFAEDGSFVTADAVGEGRDYGDKASNKSASIGHKYALLQVFNIKTEDLIDPDAESPQAASQTKVTKPNKKLPNKAPGAEQPAVKFDPAAMIEAFKGMGKTVKDMEAKVQTSKENFTHKERAVLAQWYQELVKEKKAKEARDEVAS